MACTFCKNERHPHVDDSGNCMECQNATCTNPSGRSDDRYHGEWCYCGCAKVVCVHDIKKHSLTRHRGSSVQDCFPELSLIVGLDATWASVATLDGSTLTEQNMTIQYFNQLSFFLTRITPGTQAMEANPYLRYYVNNRIDKIDPSFYYSNVTREKVLRLTLDLVSKAWANLAGNFGSRLTIDYELEYFAATMGRFSSKPQKPKSLTEVQMEVLYRHIRDFTSRALSLSSSVRPIPLANDFQELNIPRSDQAIAVWLSQSETT